MELEQCHLEKVGDDFSRIALSEADGEALFRVIYTLDEDQGSAWQTVVGSQGEPISRYEMRKRLIDKKLGSFSHRRLEILKQLSSMLNDVKGNETPSFTSKLVADGNARQILQSLKLTGVKSVQVDRKIGIETR